jgi:alpha-ketoglutarate-dependent taurine dioxygenase
MNLKNIHDHWGTVVNFDDPKEFFLKNPKFWRDLAYQRKVIIFKKMNFAMEDYIELCLTFGRIWNSKEYLHNKEVPETFETKFGKVAVSSFSNKLTTLANRMGSMPWHADIASPDDVSKSFCFRTLWITKNPNPETSGKTTWLEIEEGMKYLSEDQLNLISRTKVIQQSWVYPGTGIKEFDLIKEHPITGKKSLRLNWFNDYRFKNAYIIGVKIDGTLQKDCGLIKDFFKFFEQFDDLLYEHTWDTYDIVLYDNWPSVHRRSRLSFNENLERHFYRSNIDHLDQISWEKHIEKYR